MPKNQGLSFNLDVMPVVEEILKLTNDDVPNLIMTQNVEENIINDLRKLLLACQSLAKILENPKTITLEDEEIIKLGTVLLFELREFFTKEDLKFTLAGATSNGNLKEHTYSYKEILNMSGENFTVEFGENGYIRLKSALFSLKNLNQINKKSVLGQWQKILNYGFITDYKTQAEELGSDNYKFYHKNSADLNVYMKFSGTSAYHYYMYNKITKSQMIPRTREDLYKGNAYDRGWLYQWVKLKESKNQTEILDDKSNTPLLPLFLSESSIRENVPGIKGGDNLKTLEQYKYNNKHIISLNNIHSILVGGKDGYIGIIPGLHQIIDNFANPRKRNKGYRSIVQDFTVNKNKTQIANFVRKSFNDMQIYQT